MVTGVQTCALPISSPISQARSWSYANRSEAKERNKYQEAMHLHSRCLGSLSCLHIDATLWR